MPPPFGATWGTLRDRCEELPADSTLITPLATKRFRITDVQQSRVIIEDTDSGDTQPLQGEQFATLAGHVSDATTPDAAISLLLLIMFEISGLLRLSARSARMDSAD